MNDPNTPKVSWGHQGSIGKFHVDLIHPDGSQSHHHSPTLNPLPRNEEGHILVRSWGELPGPYGSVK